MYVDDLHDHYDDNLISLHRLEVIRQSLGALAQHDQKHKRRKLDGNRKKEEGGNGKLPLKHNQQRYSNGTIVSRSSLLCDATDSSTLVPRNVDPGGGEGYPSTAHVAIVEDLQGAARVGFEGVYRIY